MGYFFSVNKSSAVHGVPRFSQIPKVYARCRACDFTSAKWVRERSRLLELLDEGDVVDHEQDLADVATLLGRVLLGEGDFALLPWQLRHANNDVGYNVHHGSQAVLLKRTSRGASRRCSCQFVEAS
jgi:hypothetical protein